MKTTPFYDFHKSLGAKMHEFAGFEMPIEYKNITEEHADVLRSAGVFDVSHMGEIWVRGENAIKYLQKMTSNDVRKLQPGKIQYSCLMNEKGGVVDDFLLYIFSEEKFLLVVNASNIEKDYQWLLANLSDNVDIINASDDFAQLAVQGPLATRLLQHFTCTDLSEIKYYTFKVKTFADCPDVILSNTGYTGAGGFELYFDPKYSKQIWDALFSGASDITVSPIGLGARDTLRLEMGFCLYGHELSDDISPLEAGLGWITKFVDNKPFLGRETLEKQKAEGLKRKLIGFKLIDKGIARHGYEVVDKDDKVIGTVTSGSISPYLKVGIGMAFVDIAHSKPETEIFIKVRNRNLKAKIVKTPFRS